MTAVEPQVAAGTREQLIRQLAGLGGIQAPDGGAARGAVTVRIPAEALEEATNRLAARPESGSRTCSRGVRGSSRDSRAAGGPGVVPPGQQGPDERRGRR